MLDPPLLGNLFRCLQVFESLFESEGIDHLSGPDGDVYCLADILRLQGLSQRLAPEQALAIHCIYLDMTDADAARLMNAEAHQVSEYAREGLRQLCAVFEPEQDPPSALCSEGARPAEVVTAEYGSLIEA